MGEELPLVVTEEGRLRHKYRVKAACQSVAFVLLVAGYGLFNVYSSAVDGGSQRLSAENDVWHRRTETDCDDVDKADPGWLAVFHCIGILYMFLALAIVCDEFFVPALEEMSSTRHLNLSMDVAGATLMAAGGSAPELFTSLFGTFQDSSIGFGTIVGSAVFNVLFVIAMCSLLSKDVLCLTWWPLFRDSLCYALGLVALSIFVGVHTPEEIELWEAIVLFVMYIGYILIMWQNRNLYKALTGKELPEDGEEEEPAAPPQVEESNGNAGPGEMKRSRSQGSMASGGSHRHSVLANVTSSISNINFRWQGTFRAGILKLLRDPESWVETAGVGIVAKIAGDADFVFNDVDIDGNGFIDHDELKQLFDRLECHVSDRELDEVFATLDVDKDGVINRKEFTSWYVASEERILSQVRHVFDSIDIDHSGTIDKRELRTLLEMLDPHVTDEDVDRAVDSMYKHGSRDEVTFEEFSEWYRHSLLYERQIKAIEEDQEGAWESLYPPESGASCFEWTQYLVVLPLVVVMTFTIPDVRRPGWSRWCYLSFLLSVLWIGIFSFLMVSWTETVGNTIGIPSVIMGLTVLAAGTSVPDLLSSVIVARRGSGDMAVSSSIGSNIFDILVGLPIPWIIYIAWPNSSSSIEIGSDNIWISIMVLLGMLVFVIVAVHCQGWRLTKTLGGMMLLFYVGFLAQAIILELPFEVCTSSD